MKVDQTPLQLQAQLQRQLQGQIQTDQNAQDRTAARSTVRTPYDGAKQDGSGRALVARDKLSSEDELQAAKQKVQALTGTSTREAPLGRVSAKQEEERRQPLGQIIDIRV
ncbi:hypothetical protein [Gimibacter soli]|uniref:Uncharacterized protein n=1 Tax=Gimibacter soli TaxID=3024400 RepID=A0AAE9XT43_9PROT|nr:hypothetical protein [Gimibacter soli]WCL54456.1 hypothetical protein PH603_01620 [Gimibacter soli]